MRKRKDELVSAYVDARGIVLARGYSWEIEWQANRSLDTLEESEFLGEYAWVVLNSGMREAVVRSRFPGVAAAFCHWRSASEIVAESQRCRAAALKHFAHAAKVDAIVRTAAKIADEGFRVIRAVIAAQGVDYLECLPYLGPVTKFHLGKNIGLDVAKPDRHLSRLCSDLGYSSASELCSILSTATGDSVSVVDSVVWRYATLEPEYLGHFSA